MAAKTICFSPDGTTAGGVDDGPNFCYGTAASRDGKWIAGGANDGSIYLWKTAE